MSHEEGPRWKIVGRYGTFEEADRRRKEISQDEDTQVKVHFMGPSRGRFFAVKARLDPAKRPPPRPNRKKKRRK